MIVKRRNIMKKSDIFLLKAIPYVIGTILLVILIFLDYRFHEMDWMLGVKVFLFWGFTLAPIFELIDSWGPSYGFVGREVVVLRVLTLIQCIFFFTLLVLSAANDVSYSWVIAILNGIGFFLISFYFGFLLNDPVQKYIKKYYN